MSSISLVLLTWNRADLFVKTMDVSLRNTDHPINEIIWCDNGSEPDQYAEMDSFMKEFNPTARIRFSHNTGMTRGFNSALQLCRTDYVVLSGPDVLHPDGWIAEFVKYMDTIPNAAVVAQYIVPIESVPERYRTNRNIQTVAGLPVYRAMPMDHYCIRRNIFKRVGYWHEGFGPYGFSDVEWLHRVERHFPNDCYVIPHMRGHHMGTEGVREFKTGVDGDSREYHKWKQDQCADRRNHDLMAKCARDGYPPYWP